MTLSDLASFGSFVSGVAVLVSLIFLFFQMRQMTEQVRQAERNQRALMQQGRADRVSANCLTIAANADLARVFARGRAANEPLSEEDVFRFLMICRSAFSSAEDSFLQHHSGALDDKAFKSFDAGVRQYFTVPGIRAAWRMSAQEYGDEYRNYVDRIIAETKVATLAWSLDRWNAALAADA